jgi:hypothetical protein
MHILLAALIASLLAAWPAAAGQPGSPGESPAAPAHARTEDQVKQAQEALKMEGFHPGCS